MSLRFPKKLRIGTRGSPLALAQTRLVLEALQQRFPELKEADAAEIITIRASGDYDPKKEKDEPLVDVGGKGLFTKELEEALLAQKIDIAVHSMKDVPTWLPRGLFIAAVLPRSNPVDAFISNKAMSIEALAPGSVFGTCSLRRQAQILHLRPDLKVAPLRGNIETRLRKLEEGRMDAMLLAAAGLMRLGLAARITSLVGSDIILPSPAQGIIGLEMREGEEELRAALVHISHKESFEAMQAERAMLEVLDGNCTTPIAALAMQTDGKLHLKGLVAHPEGKHIWRAEAEGRDAIALGREVGRMLRRQVPPGILPD